MEKISVEYGGIEFNVSGHYVPRMSGGEFEPDSPDYLEDYIITVADSDVDITDLLKDGVVNTIVSLAEEEIRSL